jgi:hypothetical protein
MSLMGQERRIGHVRGMSAEPSTTKVGVPIGNIGSPNGPHSPARAAGARHRRGAETGRRVADLQRANFKAADTPRIPCGRSLQRRDRGAGGQGARARRPKA